MTRRGEDGERPPLPEASGRPAVSSCVSNLRCEGGEGASRTLPGSPPRGGKQPLPSGPGCDLYIHRDAPVTTRAASARRSSTKGTPDLRIREAGPREGRLGAPFREVGAPATQPWRGTSPAWQGGLRPAPLGHPLSDDSLAAEKAASAEGAAARGPGGWGACLTRGPAADAFGPRAEDAPLARSPRASPGLAPETSRLFQLERPQLTAHSSGAR